MNFSEYPGPRERQLQRKMRNPLFNFVLTPEVLQAAQLQDHQALQQFMEQFRELVERVVKLDKNVQSEEILLLKVQLEHQYAVCTGLAGKPVAVVDAIKKLVNTISATLRSASVNDADALEKLSDDEAHTALHFQLCDQLIVSDILNPDEVIADDEYILTLLGESEEALQAALALFPPERIAALIEVGKLALKNTPANSAAPPRLAQMQAWLQAF